MSKSWISGRTLVCGVIGYPVEHTLSPAMQNAAYRETDLNFAYLPFKVKPECLPQAIEGMRALNIRGLNVTIPHKVAVIPLLDEVDSLAANIGAVNTVVNLEGKLKGYNTDAIGFLRALGAAGVDPAGRRVVVLGAGGGSRAISSTLAQQKARLTIINRSLPAAKGIVDKIQALFGQTALPLELDQDNLKKALDQADILVNTTSVGMTPGENATLVPASLLRNGLTVFDIVYNPLKTRLIKEAAAAGATTVSGSEMLVWQGAVAFKIWTEREPPVDTMRNALLQALGSN